MSATTIQHDSLVLYKKRPALVKKAGGKLMIAFRGGETASVRQKDVQLLHPGPLNSLSDLHPLGGEVKTAWELLQGTATADTGLDLASLAELIYGEYTPASAWATWEQLDDGLYFTGFPESISVRTPDEVAQEQLARQARAAEAQAWRSFLERANSGQFDLELDRPYLREVEECALKRSSGSRVLNALGHRESPEAAHALLLEAGYWDYRVNPYPARLGLPVSPPDATLSELFDGPRLDLTHLGSFAIDDQDTQDPDDALCLDGDRLWVHVADVAALIPPDSPSDLEARARGATLYLPEGMVPMLPAAAISTCGLGLNEVSPALSFGLVLDGSGMLSDVEIIPSWVRVQRLTYEQVEAQIEEEPFQRLHQISLRYQERRRSNGALFIDLPEAYVRVRDGQVEIRPVRPTRSRDLVREAMLMAGEAAAWFARAHEIPFPFVSQDPPELNRVKGSFPSLEGDADDLAENFAMRRALSRSRVMAQPSSHAGIGLRFYSRATSPLRRYMDLVAHQQLRACLAGETGLSLNDLLERIGEAEAVAGSVDRAESLSRRHWTLVYLSQNPDWCGEGVIVEKRGVWSRLILPELAFEAQIHLRKDLPLNSRLQLAVRRVNLPELDAYFTYHQSEFRSGELGIRSA